MYQMHVCVASYKRQLSAGWKREKALEQMRVQVELEWQRRCEDMKAEHYLAHEQLIQDLTQARDQVSLSYITQPPRTTSVDFYWCTCIVDSKYCRILNVSANDLYLPFSK